MDKFRGHNIYEYGEVWRYEDNDDVVSDTYENRTCGNCDKHNTAEGHDGCLGTLPDVLNACCGHGNPNEAYVQFKDGSMVDGNEAIKTIKQLGATNEKY